MIEHMPGTTLPYTKVGDQEAFAVLAPIFSVTKGLTLSQIHELTGLENSTVQNWIKRGWVANPQGKRYGETQVVRIILINMIRSTMQLDKIVQLMSFINGSVEDRSDDIIPDRELYNDLCAIIFEMDQRHTCDKAEIKRIVKEQLEGYTGPAADSKGRLTGALLVMALAYQASQLKEQAEEEMSHLYGFGDKNKRS